jgi:hypothetical protein
VDRLDLAICVLFIKGINKNKSIFFLPNQAILFRVFLFVPSIHSCDHQSFMLVYIFIIEYIIL